MMVEVVVDGGDSVIELRRRRVQGMVAVVLMVEDRR